MGKASSRGTEPGGMTCGPLREGSPGIRQVGEEVFPYGVKAAPTLVKKAGKGAGWMVRLKQVKPGLGWAKKLQTGQAEQLKCMTGRKAGVRGLVLNDSTCR